MIGLKKNYDYLQFHHKQTTIPKFPVTMLCDSATIKLQSIYDYVILRYVEFFMMCTVCTYICTVAGLTNVHVYVHMYYSWVHKRTCVHTVCTAVGLTNVHMYILYVLQLGLQTYI